MIKTLKAIPALVNAFFCELADWLERLNRRTYLAFEQRDRDRAQSRNIAALKTAYKSMDENGRQDYHGEMIARAHMRHIDEIDKINHKYAWLHEGGK